MQYVSKNCPEEGEFPGHFRLRPYEACDDVRDFQRYFLPLHSYTVMTPYLTAKTVSFSAPSCEGYNPYNCTCQRKHLLSRATRKIEHEALLRSINERHGQKDLPRRLKPST